MALRIIGVKLVAQVTEFVAPLNRATSGVRQFGSELDKAAKAGKLDKIAGQATKMGLALVGAFTFVEQAAARFERQMSKVDAVSDTNAAGMKKLADAALLAGRTTQYSAIEAAQAEEELAKAGISVSDILGGALKGSLALAAAGDLDLAESADVAAKAMNIFGLTGSDVSHIADVLSAGANKSATDIHGLAMALKMGGLAAGAAGMTLEQTTGTLAAFAQHALVGSDAGTSLKSMLIFLQTPTIKATALMKELGIQVYDAQGNFIGIANLAGVLQKQLGHLTQEQRNYALATIFGADAMRAANVLFHEGEFGMRGWIAAVNDQGNAAATAAKKTDNLMGDIKRLRGQLETMAIESGSGANSGLRMITQSLTALVNQFASLPPVVSGTVVVLTGLTGVVLLGSSAMVKMRASSAEALAQLAAMGPMGAKAAAGLQVASRWAGRAAVAFLALQVLGAVFKSDLNPQIDALTDSLATFAKTGKLAGESARLFGGDAGELKHALLFATDTGLAKKWENFSEGLVSIAGIHPFDDFRTELDAFDQSLAKLVTGGNAELAAKILRDMSKQTGRPIQDLTAALPGYSAALAQAAKNTGGFADEQNMAAHYSAILQQGLAGLIKETGSLNKAWEALHGTQVGWAEAQINVEQAVDDMTTALKENGNTLDIDTEAGRKNESAMIRGVKAAVDAAQSKYDQAAATKGEATALLEANDVYNQYIAKLRQAMLAQGLTKQQVESFIALYTTMPPVVTTSYDTPGLDTAISKVQRLIALSQQLGGFAGNPRAFSDLNYVPSRRWGGITEHARDGLLRDPEVFSAVSSGARYAFAEPQTGGEAFVPKFGNRAKSLSTLNHAAGWYGHTITPASSGGGVQTVHHVHTVTIAGQELLSGFRRDVRLSGGSVQNYAGTRRGS